MHILTFDESKEALLNPTDVTEKMEGCPKTVVTCFAHNLITHIIDTYPSKIIGYVGNANGDVPFYEVDIKGMKIGVVMSFVGAPMAVAVYDNLFGMGVESIVVFGTCGALDVSIADCSIIIPNIAIRDEGTSFHYAPANDEIQTNVDTLPQMIEFFKENDLEYTIGKCWTTDGIYRETSKRVKQVKEAGAICVDMECSAFAALAQFRNKSISQFFYAADNLDSEEWNPRSLANHENMDVKVKVVDIAIALSRYLYES